MRALGLAPPRFVMKPGNRDVDVTENDVFETWLVVDLPGPLKIMKVSWDNEITSIWKKKKCSKPPTSKGFL